MAGGAVGAARVLHVTESLGGGVASALADYVAATPEHRHALLFRPKGPGVPTVPAGFERSRCVEGHREAVREFRRLLHEWAPDVVHAHSSVGGAWVRLAVLRSRVRIVYTPHCFAFERMDRPPAARLAYRLVERALAVNTSALAGCSEYERRIGRRWLGEERAAFVPNTPPAWCADAAVEPGPAGPSRTALRVVAVGRLCAQKDPDWFAAVVRRLREESPEPVEATWLGDGDAGLRARLTAAGVAVSGWLDRRDLAAALAGATCYVHTAAWEGFPITVLEAAACGVPVLMRGIRSVPDIPVVARLASPDDAVAKVLSLARSPAVREENLTAWRAFLAGNDRRTQRAGLLAAYGLPAQVGATEERSLAG